MPSTAKRQIARTSQWPEIARRLALGQKGQDIAQALSLTAMTISNTINNELFEPFLEDAQALRDAQVFDVRGFFAKRLEKACQVISDTVDYSPDEKMRLNAAKESIRLGLGQVRSPGPGRPASITINQDNRTVTFEDRLEEADALEALEAREAGTDFNATAGIPNIDVLAPIGITLAPVFEDDLTPSPTATDVFMSFSTGSDEAVQEQFKYEDDS